MNITQLKQLVDVAIERGIDPETTVCVADPDDGRFRNLADDVNDPTVDGDYIWFTLNQGDECDARFTYGHYPQEEET